MKLHANLKWSTLITRANKLANQSKYRLESGSIYELINNSYVFLMHTCAGSNLSATQKQKFVDLCA